MEKTTMRVRLVHLLVKRCGEEETRRRMDLHQSVWRRFRQHRHRVTIDKFRRREELLAETIEALDTLLRA
jgi:hypothetical protein